MFEKEAEEYADEKCGTIETEEKKFCRMDWQKGATFGYNKAKEEMIQNGLALQSDMDKTIEQNIALKKELNKAKKVQVVEHFEAYGQCRDSRRIAGLEQENAELKAYNEKLLNGDIEKHNKIVELNDKLNNLSKVAEVRLANWQKYEEENKELKKKIENLQKYLDTQNSYRECAETWVKLTKAIEILKKYHNECPAKYSFEDIDAMVEQFLKEDK